MHNAFKIALLAVSCFTLPANAQQTDDELVVTATRVPTPAERLPADVDLIDVEEAQKRGVTNVADALSDVPGLGVVRSGGFGQQASLFSGGANSNHTLVLFDGVRLNDPASPGSAFDSGQDTLGGLSRIEIIQGPMSAVFGSDAIGGVVNILPRRGGEGTLNAQLDVTGGSFGSLGGTAGVDGTLGNFRYALTAEGYVTDGYDLVPERMSTHVGDEDGAESATLTGVFDLEVTQSFALDLLVRHRESRTDFDAFIYPPPTFNEQRTDDADLEISQNDLSLARLGATWRLSEDVRLSWHAGALRHVREEADGGVATSSFDGERRFADIAINASIAGASVVAGFETQREDVDIDQGFATVVAQQDHHSGFITAQTDLDQLTLTGAVRVDEFEGFGTQDTWRFGASFNIVDGVRVYGAYGASFRAPTLYERFIYFGDPNLDPEHGEALELGADARFGAFGQAEGVELGFVYRTQKIDDLIDFGPLFTYVNIDQAEIESAELRVAMRPLSWLTARASYVHTDARDGATGAALLRRPEHSWTAALDVEQGRLSGGLSWRQMGERPDQIYGDDGFYQGVGVTADYGLLRASAAWDVSDGATIYVAADNLTDEAYEPANGFAGAPRSVTFGVRLRP